MRGATVQSRGNFKRGPYRLRVEVPEAMVLSERCTVTFSVPVSLPAELAALKRYYVHLAMRATQGHVSDAAKLLGIPQRTMSVYVNELAQHCQRTLAEEVEQGTFGA